MPTGVAWSCLYVMGATTLAGSLTGDPPPPAAASQLESCPLGHGCGSLDATVCTAALAVPWAVTLGTLLLLGLPTILSPTNQQKASALATLTGTLFECALLLAACLWLRSPTLVYTVSLHAAVQLLDVVDARRLSGGESLWQFRHVPRMGLLAWAACSAPAVPLLSWTGAPPQQCAFVAHLLGCLLPQLVHSARENGSALLTVMATAGRGD
jgi:hypothetical protein